MGLINKFRKKENQLTEKEEIIEHLTDFLNTKKNFGAYPQDYGVDTYVEADSGIKIALNIMRDIRTGLETYEKRVDHVEIKHIPLDNKFSLSFEIQCTIYTTPLSFKMSFHHQKHLFNMEDL